MNRRDILKVVLGGGVISTIGITTATGEDNIAQTYDNSLPVAQYQSGIEKDTWYKRSLKDDPVRKPVVCHRIIREIANADEIMGGDWKLVSHSGTHVYLRRTGRAWINKEDAELLLHTTNLMPVRVWGAVEMSEMMVLNKQQGFFTKIRTVGMTNKTQWEERKWKWDHKHTTTISNKEETKESEFNFYREDCKPERVGDMQQMHCKVVYDGYCGVGRAERTYSLCGPVNGSKWRAEWMDKKEEMLTMNILAKTDVYSKN
jgi:hypothetical protein